ncbi:MAG: PilZ domain-containing protein [Spirochaetales bacterium]|nr:PilZ domain-containing protein [Spirochaetales bacterium]MCF7939755.1 PilZ domain-containing protein [Spirochaetales bacterium]
MKLLLVSERDEVRHDLIRHTRPLGFEFIHYRNPLKAMDNLDEIDPELIIFSAADFPRHWKPMLTMLRRDKNKNETACVILKGDNFPFEEAAKAIHLGANGIIHQDLDRQEEVDRFIEILERYLKVDDGRDSFRYRPRPYDRIEFIFSNPDTMRLVPGALIDISLTGANFRPNDPALVDGIEEGTEIPHCSLRVGETISAVRCIVARTGRTMGLKFAEFESGDEDVLRKYLDERPTRELKKVLESEESLKNEDAPLTDQDATPLEPLEDERE